MVEYFVSPTSIVKCDVFSSMKRFPNNDAPDVLCDLAAEATNTVDEKISLSRKDFRESAGKNTCNGLVFILAFAIDVTNTIVPCLLI